MPPFLHQTFVSVEDREGFLSRVLTKLNSVWVGATYPFAGKGGKLILHYASEISRSLAPGIVLGNRVAIGKHTWLHTWFASDAEAGGEVKITIEDDCCIAARCTVTAKNSIHLERGVVLSSDVLVMDHAHAYQDLSKPISLQGATPGGRIRIKKGCRIGQGVAILCERGELVLGKNCVVAPGSVVTRSFPPNSVLSGNPARPVQKSGNMHPGADQELFNLPNGACEESESQDDGKVSSKDFAASPRGRQDSVSAERYSTQADTPDPIRELLGDPRQTREDPLHWLSRAASKLRTLWLMLTWPFASFGKGAWVHYSCHVARSAARYISVGKGVGLARDVRLDVRAAPGACIPALILEENSGMQRRGLISARNRIHVMRDVIFGPSVLVMDHLCDAANDTDSAFEGQESGSGGTIRIEEECWIGFGAMIVCEQGELVVGRHSIVGANSVVRRSIPPYSVVAGNPARIVKQYDFSEGKWVLGCIRPDRQDTEPATSALS